MSAPLLQVEGLSIEFGPKSAPLRVVDDISFSIPAGGRLGVVGESGSGKSMTSLSILRLIPEPPGRIATGRILFEGVDLLALPRARMPDIRGRDIAMIFQEPMSSLNPLMTIGDQVGEAIYLHERGGAAEREAKVIEILRLVGIPDPAGRMRAYPHQFSGGMRQRVMIAMALACNPKLLIADEPTTALDVTIQAQVLDLMKRLRERLNTAIMFISHDLGVIADIADRVIVMYAGRIVEDADVRTIFRAPAHPYTRGLLQSIPRLTGDERRLRQIPGSIPAAGAVRRGCAFRARCSARIDRCESETPPLTRIADGHSVACLVTGAAA